MSSTPIPGSLHTPGGGQSVGDATRDLATPDAARDATQKAAQKQMGRAQREDGTPKPLEEDSSSAIGAKFHPSSAIRAIHGNLAHQQHPNVYEVSEICYFNGKRYLFKMDIPVDKQPATEEEKGQLKEAVGKWRQALITQLQKDVTQTSPILTASNFSVLCGHTPEQGVVAYIPDKEKTFDFEQDSIQDGIKSGYITSGVTIQGDIGKELNGAIASGSAEKIQKAMQSELLSPLTVSSRSLTPGKAEPLSEVGLVNLGNTCYLNSAFQQIASNQVVLDELVSHPEWFDGDLGGTGKNNEFWKALKDYKELREASATHTPKILNLSALNQALTTQNPMWQTTFQNDASEVLVMLMREVKDTDSSGLLFAEQTPSLGAEVEGSMQWRVEEDSPAKMMIGQVELRATEAEGKTIEEMLSMEETLPDDSKSKVGEVKATKKKLLFKKPPGVLSFQVGRLGPPRKKEISETNLSAIIGILRQKQLVDEQIKKLVGEENVAAFKETVEEPPTEAQVAKMVRLGKAIVENEDEVSWTVVGDSNEKTGNRYGFMLSLLNSAQQKIVFKMIPPPEKSIVPIKFPLTFNLPEGKLVKSKPGEHAVSREYHLMSYGLHLGGGTGGHYVTHFCREGRYYCANDRSVEVLSKEEFEACAAQATTVVYNRKEYADQATKTSISGDGAIEESRKEPTPIGVDEAHNGYSFSIQSAESLKDFQQEGAVAVFVNPTNSTVHKVHRSITDAYGDQGDIITAAKKTENAAKKSWFPGQGESSSYTLYKPWVSGYRGILETTPAQIQTGKGALPPIWHVECEKTEDAEKAVQAVMHKASKGSTKNIVFLVPDSLTESDDIETFLDKCNTAWKDQAKENGGKINKPNITFALNPEQAKAYQGTLGSAHDSPGSPVLEEVSSESSSSKTPKAGGRIIRDWSDPSSEQLAAVIERTNPDSDIRPTPEGHLLTQVQPPQQKNLEGFKEAVQKAIQSGQFIDLRRGRYLPSDNGIAIEQFGYQTSREAWEDLVGIARVGVTLQHDNPIHVVIPSDIDDDFLNESLKAKPQLIEIDLAAHKRAVDELRAAGQAEAKTPKDYVQQFEGEGTVEETNRNGVRVKIVYSDKQKDLPNARSAMVPYARPDLEQIAKSLVFDARFGNQGEYVTLPQGVLSINGRHWYSQEALLDHLTKQMQREGKSKEITLVVDSEETLAPQAAKDASETPSKKQRAIQTALFIGDKVWLLWNTVDKTAREGAARLLKAE